jgi:hypothetical protein
MENRCFLQEFFINSRKLLDKKSFCNIILYNEKLRQGERTTMKRKNKIGTLFSILLCMILVFSTVLFSACSNTEASSSGTNTSESSTSKDDASGSGSNTPDSSSASPDNSGNSNSSGSSNDGSNGSNGSNDDNDDNDDEEEEPVTIEYRTQSETLQAVTEAAQAQDIASLTLKGKGVAGSHLLNDSATIEGAFNIADQSGDVAVFTSIPMLKTTSHTYNYVFLRDGSLFTLFNQSAKKSAWNEDVVLSYAGADGLLDSITDMEGVDPSTLETVISFLPTILSGSVSSLNAGVLAFANYTGAATEEENKVTVDLNKALYTLARDMRVLLTRVQDDTTVESFLKDATVVEYMNNLMKDVSTDDIATLKGGLYLLIQSGMLNEYIGNSDGETDNELSALLLAFLGIQPVKNSTAYEYLVDLLCSDELSDLLTYFIKQQTGTTVEVNVGDFLVNDLFALLGTTKADIVAALKQVETDQISFTITAEGASYPIVLSETNLVFNLNEDKTIASTDIATTIKISDVPVDAELTLTYSDKATTLTDISACTVSIPHGIYNDGTKTEELTLKAGDNTVTAKPVFANNALSSFAVTVGNDAVTSAYDAEKETLTFTYNNTEYTYTVKTQAVTVSDKEMLLISVYGSADKTNAAVIYIQADNVEMLTYTVAEFLAAQKADATDAGTGSGNTETGKTDTTDTGTTDTTGTGTTDTTGTSTGTGNETEPDTNVIPQAA